MRLLFSVILVWQSSCVFAQLDSSILDGMPETYIDIYDNNKEKPWHKEFFIKKIPLKHSTLEETFYEIYLIDTALFPHINEEVTVYSVERKKGKTFYTDSTGRIEVMLPKGVWDVYVKRLGVTKKLKGGMVREWGKKSQKKLCDMRAVFIYNWEETIALNILFEPGKSTIQERSHHQLDELYEYLKRHSDIRIEIVGHTDNTGNPKANLNLSKSRAEMVKQYLVQKGISSNRLVTDGKGDTAPVSDNATEKGKAANRRTEIRIL